MIWFPLFFGFYSLVGGILGFYLARWFAKRLPWWAMLVGAVSFLTVLVDLISLRSISGMDYGAMFLGAETEAEIAAMPDPGKRAIADHAKQLTELGLGVVIGIPVLVGALIGWNRGAAFKRRLSEGE